jgi:hypothetical protein
MKKWIYWIIIFIIILLAIFTGNKLFKGTNNKNAKYINTIIENTVQQNVVQENIIVNDIAVNTTDKEKISPNAILILKKFYEECSHTIKEYAKIPEEYVNLTKEELEEKLEEWSIDEFLANEVVLEKKVGGVCNEHYILRQKDGYIAVYKIDSNNQETLQEETGIATLYLTENDKLKLEEGIRIYGKEELNSTLEDYE